MTKLIAKGIFSFILLLFFCSAAVPDTCFEGMPPPDNASFSPMITTLPFALPLREARLTSPFGYRFHPIDNDLDFHYGLDLAAPTQTPVYAVIAGIVQTADSHASYGNYIIIDHHNGFSTLYAHCHQLLVQEGETVKRGEKIALVGQTGEATGSHLHFEIRLHGVRYDPLWILGDGQHLTKIPESVTGKG